MKDNKNLRHITNLAKRQKLLKETLMMLICFVKITNYNNCYVFKNLYFGTF